MSVTIDRLFDDPSLFLHSIEGDHARFVEMDRDTYRSSVFFDGRITRSGPTIYRIPLALLFDAARERPPQAPKLNFIHHVAQCGSTLLARALDGDAALGIREPFALRQLGVRAGASGKAPGEGWTVLTALVLRLLGKRFDPGQPVIVKGNVPISMIAGPIAATDPGQAGILLHFPLDDYLAAVLRTPNHGEWVDTVVGELRLGEDPVVGSVDGLSTAERAAALWLSLVSHYARLQEANPQMRSLDANLLFDQPAATVAAAAELFGVAMTSEQATAVGEGPLFHSYGKNPDQPYDPAQRIERRDQTRRERGEELAAARRWVEGRLGDANLPDALANPLLGEASLLL